MIRKYHNHKSQKKPWHREEEPLTPRIVSEYDQEIPQSQTTDNPVAHKATYNKT